MRELRSHNTWMHNVPRLVPDDRRPAALVHPDDAKAASIADGTVAVVESAHGQLEFAAKVTSDVMPGTIAIPHGWGHAGGWRRANAAGGSNSNVLASADPEDIEPIAGMSILNGIPVRIRTADGATVPARL
jgi:formate dehydrogenase